MLVSGAASPGGRSGCVGEEMALLLAQVPGEKKAFAQ